MKELIFLQNEHLKFEFDTKTNSFSIFNQIIYFKNIKTSAIINFYDKINFSDGKILVEKKDKYSIEIVSYSKFQQKLFFSLVNETNPFIVIRYSIKNNSTENINLEKFILFECDDHNFSKNLSFYKNGYYSWSASGILLPGKKEFLNHPRIPIISDHSRTGSTMNRTSDMFSVITDLNNDNQVTLGFTSHFDQFNHVRLYNMDQFIASCELDHILFEPNEEISSEEFFLDFSNGYDALEHYTTQTSLNMDPIFPNEIPIGWSSWYQYYEKINENIINENLEYFSSHKNSVPIKYFQIDDGYQLDNFAKGAPGLGDWLFSNENFPNGMEALAKNIREKGFIPGIWVAPFMIGTNSEIAKVHPDMILKDFENNPIQGNPDGWRGDPTYSLDLSNPISIQWLKYIFNIIANGWGFKFIKIDFTYAGAYKGKFYNKKITRAQAYRNGLQAIKESIGDAFLLNCGAPIGPSIGLVQGMRIGEDVSAEKWDHPFSDVSGNPCMIAAIKNTINRFYMHRKFWINDPDCLMLRNENTNLTKDEIVTWTTIVALSNGSMLISDEMKLLKENDLSLFKKIFPVYDRNAVPLDFFKNELSDKLLLDVKSNLQNWKVLGLFNWADNYVDKEFSFSEIGLMNETKYHIFDFWNEEYLGSFIEKANIKNIPKHGVKLLIIKEAENDIQFISSSIHFTGGAVELKTFKIINKNKIEVEINSEIHNTANIYLSDNLKNILHKYNIETNRSYILEV